GRLRGLSCALGNPKMLGGAPKKRGVADRLGRRKKQQALCVSRERKETAREALLDPYGEGQRRRQPKPAGELAWGHAAWKLEQGERVSTGLGDDPFEHGFVEACHEN
ncbi:MAG: hypothetical protein QOI27_2609, partial [Gaiellaceae bacterium]|nr:hypothetical protein [Gaiellaceae bacterium]